MLRISALNEELSEDSSENDEPIKEKPTKEAEEAEALGLYKEALDVRQKNETEAALKLFHETLALPCIESACPENDKENCGLSSTQQIKFACLKNIGALYKLKGSLEDALEAYLEAVEVDPLDVLVWYNIGKISMDLLNYQLARHAFLQALTCSPNHWPSLDELISVIFGVGDDMACLFYIKQALERDPFYIKGHILRDSIFEDMPWLKKDIKSLSDDKWDPLFENCSYTESEKLEYLQEVRLLRDAVAGQHREVILPTVPIAKKIETPSWAALGQSLVATYNWIASHPSYKLSCPVDLHSLCKEEEAPAVQPVETPAELPAEASGMEVDADEQEAKTSSGGVTGDVDSQTQKQASSNEEVGKSEPEAPTVDTKTEVVLAESNKRKRSREETAAVALLEKENLQRRSTRSRAYAEQAEEEIDSLRAELRSFLPTSLLQDDLSDVKKDSDPADEQSHRTNPETTTGGHSAGLLTDEERQVSDFITEGQSIKYGILQLLNQFCIQVAELDECQWPENLSHVYQEAYQLVRCHFGMADAFHNDGDQTEEFERLRPVLAHAEILVSDIKADSLETIPPWFMEDLVVLFQIADEVDPNKPKALTFQARVFWLQCRWHTQNGRVQVAMSYLDMLKRCLTLSETTSIHTQALKEPKVFGTAIVRDVEEMLLRTVQLEDVERLYQEKSFERLVEILKATFAIGTSANTNQEYRVPVDRPTQLEMLLEGLTYLEDYDQYLVWAERSLDESVNSYLKSYNKKSSEENPSDLPIANWAKAVEQIAIQLEETLRGKRSELRSLDRRSLVRLAENLVLVCSHQLEASDSSTKMPLNSCIYWILLHRVIESEENRLGLLKKEESERKMTDDAEDGEEDEEPEPLPCSILFLTSAHDLLGKRSWCMQGGSFVPYALEVLMRKRRVTSDPDDLEELGRAIEQASYCALGYPTSKKIKNRYMVDHGGSHVPYTWSRVRLLAEFFLPSRNELPEFDTVKPTSNADQEMLLQKIVSLIPPELDPKNKLEDIQDFIQGRRPNIPDYLKHSGIPAEIENVFYLLGDYYFKNKEWAKAIENYMLDLALVPDRFDSWAALALATGSRLETKVNSCERLKNLGAFFDRAEAALRCFRRALRLRPLQTTLWIEQGSTAYMLHSFCSQLLRNETDSLSIELFERVEKERERMLDIAHDCFVAADKAWLTGVEKGTGEDQDERWLHHYMLGKIAEKRSRPLNEFIDHYQRAAKLLEESAASYPKRISYNTPPQLSIEALEIYYRIHSNCLKALMSLEGRPPDAALSSSIYKQLQLASKGFFAQGGRRSSVEQKEEAPEKEGVKRKAAAKPEDEEERAAKKCAIEPTETKPLEGRAAAIFDVQFILNEVLEQVVQTAKPQRDGFFTEEGEKVSEQDKLAPPESMEVAPLEDKKEEEVSGAAGVVPTSSSSSSSSSDSSSSDSDSESSSSSDVKKTDDAESGKEQVEEPAKAPAEDTPAPVDPTPELQVMVDMCLNAIKDCVGRFSHFYKGLYRLTHYYYHSKTNRNIDACRELFFGRPVSASIVQMQQQQGVVQVRFLPVGVAGLFTEWRANNFYNGIWRIPINEIDRPGCFAAHIGRSTSLLLEVLRETRDHRVLMELALALQPEPEPDKKYLFDSEREQHAAVALSLMQQVLRSRLQEIKDAPAAGSEVSPQQGSPSSSKKLSLLMDAFRAYDRIQRNLPGKETPLAGLLVECYKVHRGSKDQNEPDANVLEQALTFCRQKQAQSRVRVGGVRGAMTPSLGVVATRGKRGYGARRGKSAGASSRMPPAWDRPQGVTSTLPSTSTAPPAQNSVNVMQEALKLLQSAGGSADNLPQHLKNIPGISNLLAMFSKPGKSNSSSSSSKPSTSSTTPSSSAASSKPQAPAQKKESSTPAVSTKPTPSPSTSAKPASSTASSTASAGSDLLSQMFGGMGGMSSLASNAAALGAMDPTLLAMLSNPYLNPLSMLGGPMGAVGGPDPNKLQKDYQQQLMNWMQTSLAQSYAMSAGMNPAFFPTRGRGRGVRKPSSGRPFVKPSTSAAPGNAAAAPRLPSMPDSSSSSVKSSGAGGSTSTSRPPGSSSTKRPQEKESASKSGGAPGPSSKLPIDLKLPLPHFDSFKDRPTASFSGDRGKSTKTSSSNLPSKMPQTSSASHSKEPSRIPTGMSLPTVDVNKLLAGLPPSIDLGRLGKMDHQRTSSAPAKPPKSLSLGPDITVTTTQTSSKPKAAHSSSNPSAFVLPPPSTKSNKSATSAFDLSVSGGIPHGGHLPAGRQSSASDFQNIAFSVLQNLPLSMSLLVKPPQQAGHPTKKSTSSSGALDLATGSRSDQRARSSSHQPPSAPKLKMPPGLQQQQQLHQQQHGGSKGKSLASHHQTQFALPARKPGPGPAVNMPSSASISISQTSTQQRVVPSSLSIKDLRKGPPKERKTGGDSDDDVVVLD